MKRPGPLFLLTLAVGVVGANSMVLAPITAAVARDIGGAPADIVQAAAAFGLATALSALLLAPRADVIGADRALKQAVAILLISLVLSALAPGKGVLIAAQAVGGIGAGMAMPAIYGLASQVGPPGQEKRSLGIVLSGWTLALVGGVSASGFLADWAGWRAVYVLLAGLMTLVAVLLQRIDLRVERTADRPTSPLTALRVDGISRGLLSSFAMMLAFYGTYAFLGAHVADELGKGASEAGVVTLAYGLGFGAAAFLDARLHRLGRRSAGLAAFGGLALVYLAFAVGGHRLTSLTTIAFVWGIFQHFALNAVVSRLAALDVRQRGAILGLNSAATYLAVTAGALLFRFAYGSGGFAACAILSALCALVAAAELLWPRRAACSS